MARIVTDFLDQAVNECPDQIAYVDERRQITYSNVRKEAMYVANSISELGVSKKAIAIYLPKSIDCVVSMWGTLYSGNYFSVMNTESPIDYIKGVFDILLPSVVITNSEHIDSISSISKSSKIILAEEIIEKGTNHESLCKGVNSILSTDLCYVIFTSGSTGTPKGVVSNHAALVEAVEAWADLYRGEEKSIVASQFPLYYGAALWCDIVTCVKCRSKVLLVPDGLFLNPGRLIDYLNENKVTRIAWATAAIRLLMDFLEFDKKPLVSIKEMYFGGEDPSIILLMKIKEVIKDCRVFSIYASTECTGIMYSELIDGYIEKGHIPLGRPFHNTNIIVKQYDEDERGKIYELYVKSTSLTQGYYRNPELTRQIYVQNPEHDDYIDLVLKTGDMIRMSENGELLYAGRTDFQTKKNGNIVNLIEVENVANTIVGIGKVGCIINNDEICLYFDGICSDKDVYFYLRNKLPKYMIPDHIVKLESVPITYSGKIDRVKLKSV